jgi:DNA-binding response OmpR family regulator
MTRILVVEDEEGIADFLRRGLILTGYEVDVAYDGESALSRARDQMPDLVILDLMLPDEDGFTLARELRAGSNIGIVMLTGKTDTVDKIVGLEIGADDYVTKPFDERELLARVRSVLRRISDDAAQKQHGGSIARFAGWTMDLAAYELTSPAGEQIHLTNHEFQLLSALVTHGHRVLSRDAILELVAGRDWDPEDRSVDVLVGKLRKKLESDPHDPKLIKTVRGAGYILTAKVTFPPNK